jgi:hypothetical protein
VVPSQTCCWGGRTGRQLAYMASFV